MIKLKKFEELDYEQLKDQTIRDFHVSKSDTVEYPDVRNMNRDELKDYLETIGVPSRMRRIKMFEEFGFDEVTQIIISMFEDIEVSPEMIEIPGTELRIWQYSNEDNKEGIDLKRCEYLLGEIGWEIRLEWEATGRDITRYCVAYETKWWNSLLVDDLNEAVYGVQSVLGQDDGGFAGQHFSDTYDDLTGVYLDAEEAWWRGDDEERSIILMNYLIAETHQLYSE